MNGTGEQRYSANWEKLSKWLRLVYHCAVCGEKDYAKKECHHIDGNKKNSTIQNALVLCTKCHRGVEAGTIPIPNPLPVYNWREEQSVKIALSAATRKDWFNSKEPIRIITGLKPEVANKFRKDNVKGFIQPGSCNIYIGLTHQGYLIGVLGFSNADMGTYDVFLKADTTPPDWDYSTDLLLYVMRTKQVQEALEKKFNREIKTAMSMCFSQHDQINRYRKHGEMIKKVPAGGGYNLGYLFNLGDIPTLKAAKAMFMQKHKME